MYKYIYVHKYIYIYVYIYIYAYQNIPKQTDPEMQHCKRRGHTFSTEHPDIHVYTHTYTHIHTHIYTYTHTHIHIHQTFKNKRMPMCNNGGAICQNCKLSGKLNNSPFLRTL